MHNFLRKGLLSFAALGLFGGPAVATVAASAPAQAVVITPFFSAVPQHTFAAIPSTIHVVKGEHLLIKGERVTVLWVNNGGGVSYTFGYSPATPASVNGHPQAWLRTF